MLKPLIYTFSVLIYQKTVQQKKAIIGFLVLYKEG